MHISPTTETAFSKITKIIQVNKLPTVKYCYFCYVF